MRRLLLLLAFVLLLAPSLARAQSFELEPERDADLELADRYFAMHLGSNVATGVFGTASLVGGIHQFTELGTGGSRAFLLGLTLTSMGVASMVTAGTGAEANVRVWRAMKANFEGASDAERRLLREAEAARLRRLALNRAIGLAADGTFLGLGIFLLALQQFSGAELGLPLVLNGAFLLGLDIFRLVVDDQSSKQWLSRNRSADEGYFATAPRFRKPQLVGAGVTPVWDGQRMGTGVGFTAVF